MTRKIMLPAAIAALFFASAALADDGKSDGAEIVTNVETEAVPAKLVRFDGGPKVLTASKRLRIWRSHLAYKLTVNEQGVPTECELTEKFRRKYVSVELCKVLIAHHEFEPARDAKNMPVEGAYANRLSYMDLRNAK